MASTCGLSASFWPMEEPEPITKLNKPSGMSCLEIISLKATALAGVMFAGFQTTAFPNASAGAIFQLAVAVGKFQGDIIATVPIASRRTSTSIPALTESAVSPL